MHTRRRKGTSIAIMIFLIAVVLLFAKGLPSKNDNIKSSEFRGKIAGITETQLSVAGTVMIDGKSYGPTEVVSVITNSNTKFVKITLIPPPDGKYTPTNLKSGSLEGSLADLYNPNNSNVVIIATDNITGTKKFTAAEIRYTAPVFFNGTPKSIPKPRSSK